MAIRALILLDKAINCKGDIYECFNHAERAVSRRYRRQFSSSAGREGRRAAYAAGTLDDDGLKAVEDEAIRDLVDKQKAAGLQVITDGEFRRSYWHLDFMWGLSGIERRTSRTGYMFHDEETTADTAVVTGPISGENHPFVEHFKFVKALE
ncbi:MAG: hypothetical protein ACLU0O_13265, partial [Collinsella sp.]